MTDNDVVNNGFLILFALCGGYLMYLFVRQAWSVFAAPVPTPPSAKLSVTDITQT